MAETKLLTMPNGFVGDPFEVNQSSIEHKLLSAHRHTKNMKLNMKSTTQANLVMIFQALHRTQQYRIVCGAVVEDVAAALGHGSPAGVSALARIVDYYCNARLRFHRETQKTPENRRILHVVVDEEIRFRLSSGQNVQVVTAVTNQREAKNRYIGEMQGLIRSHFASLMTVWLPETDDPRRSAANRHFGILNGLDLQKTMKPLVLAVQAKRNQNDFTLSGFLERQASARAADTTDHVEDDNDDDGEDVDMTGDFLSEPNGDNKDAELYTDEQIAVAEMRRAALEARDEASRKAQQKIAALEAEIAGFKKAQEQWARGLSTIQAERNSLADEVPDLRRERDRLSHAAWAANAIARQREEENKDLLRQNQDQAREINRLGLELLGFGGQMEEKERLELHNEELQARINQLQDQHKVDIEEFKEGFQEGFREVFQLTIAEYCAQRRQV